MTILWESACGCSSDCPCGRRIRELEAGLLGCRQARSELEAELAYFRRSTDRGILRAFDDLKARVRELEAALETKTTWWLNEKARAEKAETDARESLRLVRFMEARVAELERWIERYLGGGMSVKEYVAFIEENYPKPAPATATVGAETPSQGVQEREAD